MPRIGALWSLPCWFSREDTHQAPEVYIKFFEANENDNIGSILLFVYYLEFSCKVII